MEYCVICLWEKADRKVQDMVEVKNLNLYLKKKFILKDMSFTVESGRICGFVGGNGSGKTMLMKCISGLIPATEGEIIIDGLRIGRDVDFPEELGLMIETPEFVDYMSGYQNLKALAAYRNRIGKERIREVLTEVGLNPKMKRSVKKYSLGMRQRLGIAQAIMEEPKLLILDEPFNSLDDKGVMWLREWLLRYKAQGKSVLLSSHNKEDIRVLCDMVIHLKEGRIEDITQV